MHEVMICILLLVGGGFIKVVTTLQIFRVGLGLYGGAAGVLVLLLSVLFSFFIVSSVLPLDVIFKQKKSEQAVYVQVEEKILPFLKTHTSEQEVRRLTGLREKLQEGQVKAEGPEEKKEQDLSTLLLAFSLGELREAFELGLLFILPFVLIDIFVVHLLQLLSITQIAAWNFALPLKLLLFLAIDGWTLISQRLIGGYL